MREAVPTNELQRLVAKWRTEAAAYDMYPDEVGRRKCADELEAILSRASQPAPKHDYSVFDEVMDAPHTDFPGETCWCGYVNSRASGPEPLREAIQRIVKGWAWIRNPKGELEAALAAPTPVPLSSGPESRERALSRASGPEQSESERMQEELEPLPRQASGPKCKGCGAFTTYARVNRGKGLCMKCETLEVM